MAQKILKLTQQKGVVAVWGASGLETIRLNKLMRPEEHNEELTTAITAEGSGYTAGAAVTFTGGSGTGAEGIISVESGAVKSLYFTNVGEDYSNGDILTINASSGSGGKITINATDEGGKLRDQKVNITGLVWQLDNTKTGLIFRGKSDVTVDKLELLTGEGDQIYNGFQDSRNNNRDITVNFSSEGDMGRVFIEFTKIDGYGPYQHQNQLIT